MEREFHQILLPYLARCWYFPMGKISISETRNPRASPHLLRELELPTTTVMDQCGIREERAGSREFDHSAVVNVWDRGQRPGCLQTEWQQMSCSPWLLWEILFWIFLELSCLQHHIILETTSIVRNTFWGICVAEWIRGKQQEKSLHRWEVPACISGARQCMWCNSPFPQSRCW